MDDALRIYPGPGLVARFGDTTLVAVLKEERHEIFARELVMVLRTMAQPSLDPSAVRLARRLAGLLALSDAADAPAFAMVSYVGGGGAVFVHGDVEVHLEFADGRTEWLSGRGVLTWVDRALTDRPAAFRILPVGTPDLVADAESDLRAGVVRGVGVAFGAVPAPPSPRQDAQRPDEPGGSDTPLAATEAPVVSPPAQPGPAGSRPLNQPFTVVSLHSRPDVPPRTALAVAALPLGPAEQTGPMPDLDEDSASVDHLMEGRLGWVVLDDGAMYVLDADYVVGRAPYLSPPVQTGAARPLVVDDEEHTVSRVHAKITLNRLAVVVADAGSANGTFVAQPAGEWQRLVDDAEVTVTDGTRLMIGGRTLLFQLDDADTATAS